MDSDQENNQQSFTNYGDPQYWENRYKKTRGQRFDWLENFQSCFSIIENYLQKNKNTFVLNIGCGNGSIQDELYEAGYQNIYNNDISQICIEDMEKIRKQKNYQKMVYQVMDVQQMSYKDQFFDLVLDKSTIDALMCSDQPLISVCKMVQEVYRVLKNNGIYLIISYASPSSRLQQLKRQHVNFQVTMSQLKKQGEHGQITHYLYVCKKLPMKKFTQEEKKQFYQRIKQIQQIQYPIAKKQ